MAPVQKRKCIKGCENPMTVYKFPDEETDGYRREEWRILLNVPKTTKPTLYACDRHFSEQMRNKKYLRRDAVPDINLLDEKEKQYSEEAKTEEFTRAGFDIGAQEEFIAETPNQTAVSVAVDFHSDHHAGPLGVQIGRYVQTCKHLGLNSPRKQKLRQYIANLKLQLKEKNEEVKRLRLEIKVAKRDDNGKTDDTQPKSTDQETKPSEPVTKKLPFRAPAQLIEPDICTEDCEEFILETID